MNIASALTVVRRDAVQFDLSAPRGGLVQETAPFQPSRQDAEHGRIRRLVPGAILLAMLALLGAIFPVIF